MSGDYYERSSTSRHRFRDISRVKLMGIFKSLRRRRLRRDIFHRSSLTHSRSFPPPFADDDTSPVHLPSPDLSTSSSLHISPYRSDAVSLLSATEEDCSSGMSSSSGGNTPSDVERGRHFSPHSVPAFPTSPSMFQLRSASVEDYPVERLEQRLRRLSLGESPECVGLPENPLRDMPMDVCVRSPNVSLQRKAKPPPHDQNAVPIILVTSVDAKHAKPLPPSFERSSRTPFGLSNLVNYPSNASSVNHTLKTLPDDPFTTQSHGSTYPPDYNLTFRLPSSFLLAYPSPTKYAPETPTPMSCDHFGDCRGDLWDVLHPPLVAGVFTLPPFKLPSLSTGLFDDMSTSLPY